MRSNLAQFETAGVEAPSQNQRARNAPFDLPTIATGLLVFVGYYLGAKIGFALTFQPHPVSVLWPSNSILVAALLLTPPRIWWFILVAALPAHLAAESQSHVPPVMILCWFISNSCEALIGAGLARYLAGGPIRFTSLRNAGIFCLCVVFAGPFLSSFLDAGFVVWNHWGQDGYWELIRVQLLSNTVAALIIVPLIVTWATAEVQALRTTPLSRYLEAGALVLGLLLVSHAVLYEFGSGADSVLLFLPLPFLLWAAVRFGALGASTAISIVGFLAIWSASHGHGPFSSGTAEQNALSIQIFLIVLAIPLLFLAAVIEERVTGEIELRESESRFRIVADAAPVLLWMSGLDKLCTFFNKPWLEFTGRSLEQEMGNGWAEGVHPDDLQRCLQTYTAAFDAREPFVMQYRLRRSDGEYRWIKDDGVPRYDAYGHFAGYIGSCVDVTELINKEQALRESEDRMSLVIDAAGLGLWEWDPTKDELWGTKTRRALLGFPSSGKTTLETALSRVHADDRDRVRQALKDAAATRKDYHFEYRVVLPDGIVRWTEHRGRCVIQPGGKRPVLRGISIDVTARKQAQELFRLATEASPSGILLVDDQGRIVLANAHIEELFGYSREELIGKPVEVLVPERFAREHLFLRAAFLAAPEKRATDAGQELFARRKDGTEFPIEIGLNPVKTEQSVLVLASVADISARKLAEEEARRRREEMSRLSRIGLLGEMTASIAHELNQPLAGIISNASAGQRFIDRGDVHPDRLREILVDVAADAHRAHDVIRNIRNTIKKGTTLREPIDLNFIVMKVSQMLQPDIAANSCELETSLSEDLPRIEGDPVQIHQVLINLVSNAIDAMCDTPAARRKVQVATERNSDRSVRVSVRDYGVGIPEEDCERIFDQFFTTKEEGLGMGLTIVRSIIEAHSGTIAAENVEEGARFYFTLPISEAPSK